MRVMATMFSGLLATAIPLATPASIVCPAPDASLSERYRAGVACWPAFMVDESVADAAELAVLPHLPAQSGQVRRRAQLGRMLFFDPRLSGSGQIACASCHDPDLAWADGRRQAIGHDRAAGPRNTPSLLNASWASSYFWDGRADTLAEQALEPIVNPVEMHGEPERIVASLNAIESYQEAFAAAFGDEGHIDMASITEAIAAFVGTLRSRENRFDRFMRGKADALGDTEILGLHLFRTRAGCMNCHHGPLFSDGRFHNIGLTYYGRRYQDLGRYGVTGRAEDVGRFRTPGLRDVVLTGPWMHNGLMSNLRGVLRFYNSGGAQPRRRADQVDDPLFPATSPLLRPLDLGEEELEALEAFLHAISVRPTRLSPPALP